MSVSEEVPAADFLDGYPHPREARKIFGQDKAIASFLDAWKSERLHHAWLMRGAQGVGKATLAYRIARTLIAQVPREESILGPTGSVVADSLDPPKDCPVQARIQAQSEPRLFVLRREFDVDKKRLQTQITIDNVRRLRQFLGLSATDGGWRVIIVDPVDEMNRSSANALLKFLEEPPASTVFLLVSHAPAGLLPTIRSRCRTLDLFPLKPDALAWALEQAGAEVPRADAGALAILAGGSAGRALRLTTGDGLALYLRIAGLFGEGGRLDRAGITTLAEACAGRQGSDRYRIVLDLVQVFVARLARAGATGVLADPAVPGEADLFAKVASKREHGILWAEALARINTSTRHALAVNLDPAQCVIDTLLELDATLDRVRSVAA